MIIGLTGYKQAGKNEVAKKIAQWSSIPVIEVSYAAKLKQSLAAFFGCSVDDLEAWKNDPDMVVAVGRKVGELGIVHPLMQTVRSAHQRYGTEAHRDIFGVDFWLDAALPLPSGAPLTDSAGILAFNRRHYADALYVVTDCRFENETKRIHDLGGIVARVVGPPEIENTTDQHASEIPLPGSLIDRTILNTNRDDNYRALEIEVRQLLCDLTKE
jgi:hypothetical protein